MAESLTEIKSYLVNYNNVIVGFNNSVHGNHNVVIGSRNSLSGSNYWVFGSDISEKARGRGADNRGLFNRVIGHSSNFEEP